MEETIISKMAEKIRNERKATEEKKKAEEAFKTEQALLNICREFEIEFADQLPLLKESGINWSAHFNNNRYHYQGSYILFKKDGKALKMDFNNKNSYRYEHVHPNTGVGRSVYENWNKDDFLIFIDEELLQKAVCIPDESNIEE